MKQPPLPILKECSHAEDETLYLALPKPFVVSQTSVLVQAAYYIFNRSQ